MRSDTVKRRCVWLSGALAAALAAAWCARLPAAQPPPPAEKPVLQPQTFRPFKNMPDVLFFETFGVQPAYVDQGKVVSGPTVPAGGPLLKLADPADWGKADHVVYMEGHFSRSPLSIPHGLDPAKIYVYASIFPEETGEATVKFAFGKGDYSHTQPALKPHQWNAVSFRLADLRNKSVHPEIEHSIDQVVLTFKPLKSRKEKDAIPVVFVGQFMVTYGSLPQEALPRALAAEKRRTDAERLLDRDGYNYSLDSHDLLKIALKPFKAKIKPKTAVVMGTAAENTPEWVKALAAASAKPRDLGFTFKPAVNPELGTASPNAAGGLADMRLLLQANLAADPQFAVLAVSADEILNAKSRPEDSVRVVAERTLAEGTIPVIVVAAPRKEEEAKRFEDFNESVSRTCAKLGVPVVSMSYQIPKKDKPEKDKTPLDFTKVPPESLEKTAAVVAAALKHVQESLSKD
jgi:hypothetical protein